MKKFMDENFLLNTDAAKRLFFSFAQKKPIFDWHCHLTAKEIYDNKQPESIYELWLTGDHYKWRAMRSAGVNEKYITGSSDAYEKFLAFADTLTLAVGNPLFHWSHLELQRYFEIYDVLSASTAPQIWKDANKKIADGGFSPREIIEKSGVTALFTTDDPCDSLCFHEKLKESAFGVKVLPAFRPDKAINIEPQTFAPWLESLERACGRKIDSYEDMCGALEERMDCFKSMGCAASDQSAPYIAYAPASRAEMQDMFEKVRHGGSLTKEQAEKYRYETLLFLASAYARHGFAMELHLGAMRNNNTRLFRSLGADSGFDSIGGGETAYGLSRLLDTLDSRGALAKTVLFNLNPKDNGVFAAMIGNFQGSEAIGKMQYGSAWWFNDNIDGMRSQLRTLANLGVLGTFIGMVTDSRSFLSYPRHEYFRRILCSLIGSWVQDGLYPYDEKALERIIGGICYDNAVKYFLESSD